MTIGSATSSTPSPLDLALQALQEEDTEPVSVTEAEAMDGDPVAQRKMEYQSDQQTFTANMATMRQLPPPGSLFNAKA